MWSDRKQERFENKHEQGIFLSNKWPQGYKAFETEGLIRYEKCRTHDVLFNSRFESGNCRQVFKVPQEADYEYVDIEPTVPDYLPPEL